MQQDQAEATQGMIDNEKYILLSNRDHALVARRCRAIALSILSVFRLIMLSTD